MASHVRHMVVTGEHPKDGRPAMLRRDRRDRDINKRLDEDLSEYLDGDLSARRRRRLEGRLKSDPQLREALGAMRRIREAARSDEPEADPQDFHAYYSAIAGRLRRPDSMPGRAVPWRWAVPAAAMAVVAAGCSDSGSDACGGRSAAAGSL